MKHRILMLWAGLSPKYKRYLMLALGVSAIGIIVTMVSPKQEENKKNRHTQETIKSVLTDRSTREIGMDSLAADIKTLLKEKQKQDQELEKIKRNQAELDAKAGNSEDLKHELEKLNNQFSELKDQNKILSDKLENANKNKSNNDDNNESETPDHNKSGLDPAKGDTFNSKTNFKNANEYFANAPLPQTKPTPPSAGAKVGDGSSSQPKNLTASNPATGIKINSFVETPDEESKAAEKKDEPIAYLPSGSILTGVLLNGMDAPTGNAARKDPFPATLRIQKEAILPNRFRSDVRECFAIISGYGDMSSERAYLRAESISCVRKDGGIIDTNLDAYAVGEDGKAGVRGRLVSKQGQIIARSLMAGFLSGVSQAFNVNPVPVISTSSTGQQQYDQVFSNELLQGAAVKGASSGLDRIAKFYLDMAESMFPVVEVDAGRQIDLIIKHGARLQAQSVKDIKPIRQGRNGNNSYGNNANQNSQNYQPSENFTNQGAYQSGMYQNDNTTNTYGSN